ncbi:hypothetical protein GWI33_020674 [Rhynchophorus ferrugineus]|uniref:Mitochondrial import inner membrane translocase subunit TIM50 n=1 Tax=Rhynchophorus ferrugineus TaxID=354439 RepID=A0A834M094_RHYFE|nr:hypothetical protein GWI33_020674 [Rhynchophorus ferrugineus]
MWRIASKIQRKLKVRTPHRCIHTADEKNNTVKNGIISMIQLTIVLSGVLLSSIGTYLVVVLGAPEEEEDGTKIKDEFTEYGPIKSYLLRAYRELLYYRLLLKEPSKEKLLPDSLREPYLQPKYTLVMELKNVLVHAEWTRRSGWKYKKRPLINYLFESLKDHYEIVIFTLEPGMIGFPLIDAIDPQNHVAFKLVQDAAQLTAGRYVKTLHNLNRDPSKVVCVDWEKAGFRFDQENLFCMKPWNGDENDTALLDLVTFLKAIADNDVDDVREVLQVYSKYDDPILAFRENQRRMIDQLEAEARVERQKIEQENKWPIYFKIPI